MTAAMEGPRTLGDPRSLAALRTDGSPATETPRTPSEPVARTDVEADGTRALAGLRDTGVRRFVPDASPLHRPIGTRERLDVIRDVPLSEVMSAPGLEYLRKPEAVVAMAEKLRATSDRGPRCSPGPIR